jgi:hypothetical protein
MGRAGEEAYHGKSHYTPHWGEPGRRRIMGKAIIRLTGASQGTSINLRNLHAAPVKEGNKLQDRRQGFKAGQEEPLDELQVAQDAVITLVYALVYL